MNRKLFTFICMLISGLMIFTLSYCMRRWGGIERKRVLQTQNPCDFFSFYGKNRNTNNDRAFHNAPTG